VGGDAGFTDLVTILLVISGVWIADSMAEIGKLQDCVLAGGRNCAPVRVGESIVRPVVASSEHIADRVILAIDGESCSTFAPRLARFAGAALSANGVWTDKSPGQRLRTARHLGNPLPAAAHIPRTATPLLRSPIRR
jgi:hypothetical protein